MDWRFSSIIQFCPKMVTRDKTVVIIFHSRWCRKWTAWLRTQPVAGLILGNITHLSFTHETSSNKVVRSLLNRPNGERRSAERISRQGKWKTARTSWKCHYPWRCLLGIEAISCGACWFNFHITSLSWQSQKNLRWSSPRPLRWMAKARHFAMF